MKMAELQDVTGNDLKSKTIVVYMDATDYIEGLGTNWNGVSVYPSEKSVVYNAKCAKNCGIVELKVEFSRNISSGTADYFEELDVKDVENKTKTYWDWQKSILAAWKEHRAMLADKLKNFDKQIKSKEDEIRTSQT
jgi:hypothetical protein